MRMLLNMGAMLLLAGCTASLVKVEPVDPQVKTIRMDTGSALDDGVYKSAFEKGASKACGGKSYQVLERTRKPSTLEKSGFELDSSTAFYWVVKCSSN